MYTSTRRFSCLYITYPASQGPGLVVLMLILNDTIKIPTILTFINKPVTSDYKGVQHKVLHSGQPFSKSPVTRIRQGNMLMRAGAPVTKLLVTWRYSQHLTDSWVCVFQLLLAGAGTLNPKEYGFTTYASPHLSIRQVTVKSQSDLR